MAELGFWSIAQEDPEKLSLVDPDEREVRAGELLASSNQVVHGLRAVGLKPGDAVAMVLPNSVEVFELYLAVLQAGFYLVPINTHLVGPEIAYIVQDSEAKAFVGHERFADESRPPPMRSASRRSSASPSATSPASGPTRTSRPASPRPCPKIGPRARS